MERSGREVDQVKMVLRHYGAALTRYSCAYTIFELDALGIKEPLDSFPNEGKWYAN